MIVDHLFNHKKNFQEGVTEDDLDKGWKSALGAAVIPPLLRENSSDMVLYHGSQQDDIQAFKPFTHFGTFMAAKERLEDKLTSQNRNQNIYKVSLNLKKPAHIHKDAYGNHTLIDYIVGLQDSGILTNDDKIYSPEALIKVLKSKGYDGISYFNKWEDRGSISYIIFDSNQATILDTITWANGKMLQYLRKFRKK